MPLDDLRRRVTARLDEGDRGDRGWFLITRVHLTAARLRDIAAYLHDAGAKEPYVMGDTDYRALARILEIPGEDPGVQLRRHHLLAMEKPLKLIERVNPPRWRRIRLTESGIRLATEPDIAGVFEDRLREIIFCGARWYPPTRVTEYGAFSVRPYVVAIRVLSACDLWLDRDEYDLFLSRVRNDAEVPWCVDGIQAFRQLNDRERNSLLNEVRTRVPGNKAYLNWRDMALHTFSLLNLGTSVMRDGQHLVLLAAERPARAPRRTAAREAAEGRAPGHPVLRLPEPTATDISASPPVDPALNSGTEAEQLVGKLLQSAGWTIAYYTNRRGFGFDIWAKKGDSRLIIEVKSSVAEVSSITLTRLEYEAAAMYGDNYLLAIVDNVGEDEAIVNYVQNPASALQLQERSTTEYHVSRSAWAPLATPLSEDTVS